MTFEWDASKSATNLVKHRVSFEDAAAVFLDPLAITFSDPDHSGTEHREITIGCTLKGQLLFVSHCERRTHIRIISARLATRAEREFYEEDTGR